MPKNNNRLTNRTLGIGIDTSGRTPVPSGSGATPAWVMSGASIDLWFATSQYWGQDPSQFTVTRATTAYGTFSDGTLQLFASGFPVITDLGLGIWVATTNIALQSQFAATWTATRSTLTPNNTVAPSQSTTAATLVEDSTATNTHLTVQAFAKAASAIQYTFSVYAKANTRTRIMLQLDDNAGNGATVGFDLSGKQIAYAAAGLGTPYTSLVGLVTGYSNGWCRCSLVATSNTAVAQNASIYLDNGSGTAAQSTSYSGDGASGVFIYGAQLEANLIGSPSPYIPTTVASATRNADVINFATTVAAGYTLYAQAIPHAALAFTGSDASFGVTDGSTTNRSILTRTASTGTAGELSSVAGSQPAVWGVWSQYASGKFAYAVIANTQASSFNGGSPAHTQASATVPTGLNNIVLGNSGGGASQWCGTLQRATLFNAYLGTGGVVSITT